MQPYPNFTHQYARKELLHVHISTAVSRKIKPGLSVVIVFGSVFGVIELGIRSFRTRVSLTSFGYTTTTERFKFVARIRQIRTLPSPGYVT